MLFFKKEKTAFVLTKFRLLTCTMLAFLISYAILPLSYINSSITFGEQSTDFNSVMESIHVVIKK